MQRLLELRTALTVVLSNQTCTLKKEHCNLLLKDHQSNVLERLVALLEPFEFATTVASGQKYIILSLVLPIVFHLVSHAESVLQSADSVMERSFASVLARDLKEKFSLGQLDLSSVAVMASALDPRFRHLPFLQPPQREAVRKNLLLTALAMKKPAQEQGDPPPLGECQDSNDAGKEPPAKKIKPEPASTPSSLSRLLAPSEGRA